MTTTNRFHSMCRELLDYDGGEEGSRRLSSWEVKFLESVANAATHGILTEKQEAKLVEIWDQVFGDVK